MWLVAPAGRRKGWGGTVRCPRCGAFLGNALQRKCDVCFYVFSHDERRQLSAQITMEHLEEHQTARLSLKQDYEVRYERPISAPPTGPSRLHLDSGAGPHHMVPATAWAALARTKSRTDALIIADALHRQRGWRVEVWDLDPLHPQLGAQQCTDRIPEGNLVPCDCRQCAEHRDHGDTPPRLREVR